MLAARTVSGALRVSHRTHTRWASTAALKDKYKVVVVGAGVYHDEPVILAVRGTGVTDLGWVFGAGSGGLSVANQIYLRFKASGLALKEADIAIIDAAEYHYYQVS